MKRFQNHAALVTEGGRGTGKTIAKRLYDEVAKLVICGTTLD